MPPPPWDTCRTTTPYVGFTWSRFGPICPFVRAADIVWQLPQPADAKTFAPAALEDEPLWPPQPARSRLAATSANAVPRMRTG
jgi:hypothetical protein